MADLALLIDTSVRGHGLVAVGAGDEVVAEWPVPGGVDTLQAALAEALRLGGDGIGRVVVARGPGSYIGVRSGLAAALGVAQGRGMPLHLVGSLAVVAARVDPGAAVLLALRDAGRGGVLAQAFRGSGGSWEASSPSELLGRGAPWPRSWRDFSHLADPDAVAPFELAGDRATLSRSDAAALALLAVGAQGAGVPYDLLSAEYAIRVGAER